jgi:hypothetical protein
MPVRATAAVTCQVLNDPAEEISTVVRERYGI